MNLLDEYREILKPVTNTGTRIYEHCVSSEDIKVECDADCLFAYEQMGIGILIMCKNVEIGFINFQLSANYLGNDIILDEFCIYDKPKLSEKLTDKYRGKILISSRFKDNIS